MKRVWKPLDVGNRRLYAVSVAYFDKETGCRCATNLEPPMLVLSFSPKQAAQLVQDIYNDSESPIRAECYGKAVKVLMPESWWQDGIPCIHEGQINE